MENKKTGEVYTPIEVVNKILDLSLYNDKDILKKHVIDNSCGEGAFLIEIVRRYVFFSKLSKKTNLVICSDLEKYIHGIELNRESYKKTIKNLDNFLISEGINYKVNWDILNSDALKVKKFDNLMDFVIGNPPYIRIHDLDFDYKKFDFSKKGMTDLYIIFFEIGLKMLNKTGKLAYITPNSFMNSQSGLILRKKLVSENLIEKVINLRHDNPFKGITTYPLITVLNKNKLNLDIEVYNTDCKLDYKISNNNFWIQDKFFFEKSNDLNFINKIFEFKDKNVDINVRNGLATNADEIFYNDKYKGKFVIDAIKASRGSFTKLIFPYDKNYDLIPLNEFKNKNKEIYEILKSNSNKLLDRSMESKKNWHAFARTQAIKDVYRDKITINTIIKDLDSLKIEFASSGVAVYSGLYIYSDTIELEKIENVIRTDEFIRYIRCLGKDKSGMYYYISSHDLKMFLNYAFLSNLNVENEREIEINEGRFVKSIGRYNL